MANEDFNRIKQLLQVVAETFNRRMGGDTLLFWAQSLEPHAGPRLWQVLNAALEGNEFPTLKYLREQAGGITKAGTFKETPPLTCDEKKRADNAAIISMLWLHYEHSWRLTDFGGHLLGRLFGGDPLAQLEKAKMHYDRETVAKWMEAR